jgi:hypothetical protein
VCSFDSMDHDWTLRFLQHRVGDKRLLRLIRKWLKVGVAEDGKRVEQEIGAPQGAVISPILANIYLHYVYDLWINQWRKHNATGDIIVIRYADDTILGFQYKRDADSLLKLLESRLAGFSLSLHPAKTRLLQFGRYAYLGRTCLITRITAGMISSFSQTSSPIFDKGAPQPHCLSASSISWTSSTRGNSSGKGFLPRFVRVWAGTSMVSGSGSISAGSGISNNDNCGLSS